MKCCWLILTGEYPPILGGVSDYSASVARELAARGDHVTVVTPKHTSAAAPDADAFPVVRIDGNFDRQARQQVEILLRDGDPSTRVLVQYVPHAFGCRAMNIGFARWIRRLGRRGVAIDVMYHEVAFPLVRGQGWKHGLLARVTRKNARWIADGADRIFISIPGWESMLRELGVRKAVHWLPIPANAAKSAAPENVALVRRRIGGERLVGHFGTYGSLITNTLTPTLIETARRQPTIKFVLLGRGSAEYADKLIAETPTLAGRIHAAGSLSVDGVAEHLAACEFVVQPFGDGVSSRRTSVMASLALAVPVVTCRGPLTESIWAAESAVILADDSGTTSMVRAIEAALAAPEETRKTGLRGQALYRQRFEISRTVESLRGTPTDSHSGIAAG